MIPDKSAQPGAQPVEVVDGLGRPLAVVPAAEAHRQSLPHRAALVLFFTREGKLLLGKRFRDSPVFPGRWDLTARTHILPGEAALDAAMRLVDAEFPGLGGLPCFHGLLPPGESTGFEAVSVFRYRAEGEHGDSGRELLAVSFEELSELARNFRELFAPTVIAALEGGILFRNQE